MIEMLLTSFLAIYANIVLSLASEKINVKKSICFHFLGFLEIDGEFFGGVHHIKKVSQNIRECPMRQSDLLLLVTTSAKRWPYRWILNRVGREQAVGPRLLAIIPTLFRNLLTTGHPKQINYNICSIQPI